MVQEPGNPLRWKQNNKVFKFSSQDYLVLATLRALLVSKRILLKERFEKKKNNYYILAKNKNKNLSCKTPTSFWISKGYHISFKMLGSHGFSGFGSRLCKPLRTKATDVNRLLSVTYHWGSIVKQVGCLQATVGRLEILKVRELGWCPSSFLP